MELNNEYFDDKKELLSMLDINMTYELGDKSKVKLNYMDKKMELLIENNKVSTNDYSIHSIQLVNIINNTKYETIDDIFETVIDNIDKLSHFCFGCCKKLDIISEQYATCGNEECYYKIEDIPINNEVIEYMKKNNDTIYILLTSAIYAIKSTRKYDIFEPFPTNFLLSDIKMKRGELSKLSGTDYNKYKDFKKIDSCIELIGNIDTFIEKIESFYTDTEIIQNYGYDVYKFIRFILLSNKLHLTVDNSLIDDKKTKIYKISYDFIQEEEFNKLKNNESCYLYHGSGIENWYSIMRNGLKILSKTSLMTTGAVHGNGIYMSDSFSFSSGYCKNTDKLIMGVYEVVGNRDKYKKTTNIYVINDTELIKLRYLIVYDYNNTTKLSKILDNKFTYITTVNKTIEDKKLSKGHQKLIKEYSIISKSDPSKNGFIVEPDEDNFFLWNVFINKFDDNYPIAKDMIKYKIEKIHLEINFPKDYPFYPPFIRIISPRFQYQTGHITSKGALCFELLTPKSWSPAYSIESLIVQIKAMIIEGNGKLDDINYNVPYTLQEARESFNLVARGHGWL